MSQAIHSIQRPGFQKGEFPASIFFRPGEARHSSHASFEEVSYVLQFLPPSRPCHWHVRSLVFCGTLRHTSSQHTIGFRSAASLAVL